MAVLFLSGTARLTLEPICSILVCYLQLLLSGQVFSCLHKVGETLLQPLSVRVRAGSSLRFITSPKIVTSGLAFQQFYLHSVSILEHAGPILYRSGIPYGVDAVTVLSTEQRDSTCQRCYTNSPRHIMSSISCCYASLLCLSTLLLENTLLGCHTH